MRGVFLGKASLIAQHWKVRNRRDRIAILAGILTEAKVVSTKTQIICKCNLNYRKLEPYLQILLETKLLKEVINKDGGKKFLTTKKGKEFIKAYQKLQIYLLFNNY